MKVQLDLFAWAETRPTNVIDARLKFERRTLELAVAIACGRVPRIKGDVIRFAPRQKPKAIVVDRDIERA